MLQTAPEVFKDDQKKYVNPVASANLAKNDQRTYDITPEFQLNYHLLGLDEEHHQLNWEGRVYMNIFNDYVDKMYPSELVTIPWKDGVNLAYGGSTKNVSFTTKQTLTFIPHFTNKDHSLMMLGRFELTSGNSNGQGTDKYGLSSGTGSVDAEGMIKGLSSSFAQWRSMYYTFSTHYAYKGRYMFDFSVRADGTTKFGPDRRWGYFPAVSGRWNIVDEPWMKATNNWLSMLSARELG